MPQDLAQVLLQRRLASMREQAPDPTKALDPSMLRADGSVKGKGFLGMFTNPQGQRVSEFSIADSDKLRDPNGDVYPEDQGRESYPSIVPGINAAELNQVLNGHVSPTLSDKATEFALQRRAQGKPLFAGEGEQHLDLLPMFRRTN